jgi:hypothetical protein
MCTSDPIPRADSNATALPSTPPINTKASDCFARSRPTIRSTAHRQQSYWRITRACFRQGSKCARRYGRRLPFPSNRAGCGTRRRRGLILISSMPSTLRSSVYVSVRRITVRNVYVFCSLLGLEGLSFAAMQAIAKVSTTATTNRHQPGTRPRCVMADSIDPIEIGASKPHAYTPEIPGWSTVFPKAHVARDASQFRVV